MIRVTLASKECWLVTEDPNWMTPVEQTPEVFTSSASSSTRREEREYLSNTAINSLTWTATLDRSRATALNISLRSLGRDSSDVAAPLQPILCPFWPAVRAYGDSSDWSAKYSVIFEPDWTAYAIFVTASGIGAYSSTANSMVAPLLWGVFDKLPKPLPIDAEKSTCAFSFREAGAADTALTCSATATTGPSWKGSTWPMVDELAQFSLESGGVDLAFKREQVGYTRDQAETFYPQTPARTIKSGYTLGASGASKLFSLWFASRGSTSPFWMPACISPVRLASDIAGGSVYATVDDATKLNGHSHIIIQDGTTVARRVVNISSNTIQLDSAPGATSADTAVIQQLFFARFRGNKLTIRWIDSQIAQVTVDAIELPPEYGSPAGETFGTTIGPLGFIAFLYEISDGTNYWRYTNSDTAVVYGGNTFSVRSGLSHGTVVDRGLEYSSCKVTMRNFSGTPFSRLRYPRLQARLYLTIYKATSLTPSTVETIFTGDVKGASFDDAMMIAEIGGVTAQFDKALPTPLFQKGCNSFLFDSHCTLSRTAWTFTCTMPTPPAAGSPFQYVVNSITWPGGALPSLTAHYFAYGAVSRTLADGTIASAVIVDSTAISGGAITLTLDGDIYPFPTGSETWKIVPGCAGRYSEDCKTKFSNGANFSGFPNIPKADPLIISEVPSTPSTSKK